MNGIENGTRFEGDGRLRGYGSGIGESTRARGRAREREEEEEEEEGGAGGRKRILPPARMTFRPTAWRRRDTRRWEPGVEKQIYEQRGRANDVSTVRPTGAITGGILQSLRLYLVAREHLARLARLRLVLKIIAIRIDSRTSLCVRACIYTHTDIYIYIYIYIYMRDTNANVIRIVGKTAHRKSLCGDAANQKIVEPVEKRFKSAGPG